MLSAGSQLEVAYRVENSWGVIPSEGLELTKLRKTGCTLNPEKDTQESQELRSDRAVADFRHGGRFCQGSMPFEFSFATYDDLLACALGNDWDGNTLNTGVTRKSLTVQKGFTDIGVYQLFSGVMVNTLTMEIAVGGTMVSGAFNVIGKDMDMAVTPFDASPEASNTNPPFDSFTGSLTEGGSEIAIVTSLSFELNNNLTRKMAVGQRTAVAMIPGRCRVTGRLSAYFESMTLLNKFINETPTTLACTLEDLLGNSYTLSWPRVKYTGGKSDVNDEDAIQLDLPFQAILDPSTSTTMSIAKTAAT